MKTLLLLFIFLSALVLRAIDLPAGKSTALPRLVDIGAGKCIPCKQMKPILDELTKEYSGQLEVVFIDVWENKAAGEPYGYRIIPTQVFFSGEGKELFRHEGFMSKKDILAKWKELGVALKEPTSAVINKPASG